MHRQHLDLTTFRQAESPQAATLLWIVRTLECFEEAPKSATTRLLLIERFQLGSLRYP